MSGTALDEVRLLLLAALKERAYARRYFSVETRSVENAVMSYSRLQIMLFPAVRNSDAKIMSGGSLPDS